MVEAEAEKHGVHIVSIDEIFPGYFCEETKDETDFIVR
jgi:predicted xylose isomerase-like sugar epimerase